MWRVNRTDQNSIKINPHFHGSNIRYRRRNSSLSSSQLYRGSDGEFLKLAWLLLKMTECT